MKEFLGTTVGKIVAVLAAVVVFGGIGAALMLGGKDSEKEPQGGEGEGLVVIEEGEETDEDVIDATDWEDIAGTEDKKVDEKRDTDSDGTPDKEDPDHPSNTDKEDDKEDDKDDDKDDDKNDEVTDPSGESWGPFF